MSSGDMSLAIFPSLGTLQNACAAEESFLGIRKLIFLGNRERDQGGIHVLQPKWTSLSPPKWFFIRSIRSLWSLKLFPMAKVFSLDADVANNSANEIVIGNFLPRDM